MLLHIVTFNLFFVLLWAANIPPTVVDTKDTLLSYREKICLKTPTLNISEVCTTITKPLNSSATLKTFENSCDHAIYLVHKLCEITQSDNNLIKQASDDVALLLSKNRTDEKESFCLDMLKTQADLGYAEKPGTLLYECINFCTVRVNTHVFLIKPLCNFIQWSWTFIKNSTKGNEALNNGQPLVLNTGSDNGKKLDTNQPGGNSSGINNINNLQKQPAQPAQPALSGDQNSVPSGTPKIVQGTSKVEIEGSPANNENSQVGNAGREFERVTNTEGENPNSVNEPPKTGVSPSTQVNRPAVAVLNEGIKPEDPAIPLKTESQSKTLPPPNPDELGNSNDGVGQNENEEEGELPPSAGVKGGLNGVGQLPPSAYAKPGLNGVKKPTFGDLDRDQGGMGGQQQDEGEDEEVENTNDFGEEDNKELKRKKITDTQSKESINPAMDDYNEAEDSHFFVFFFIATFVCIVFYLIYQNKRKIIAMALEGKKGRHSGRRRPTSASYQKLDNKLDEVMASSPPPSKTHVIY